MGSACAGGGEGGGWGDTDQKTGQQNEGGKTKTVGEVPSE